MGYIVQDVNVIPTPEMAYSIPLSFENQVAIFILVFATAIIFYILGYMIATKIEQHNHLFEMDYFKQRLKALSERCDTLLNQEKLKLKNGKKK